MKDLKDIIISLKQLRTEEKLKVSDEILFQESVRIFNTRFIKDYKKDKIEQATQKQLDLLYKLDVDFNAENITKQEAKELIKKTLKKQNEKRNKIRK
ncbi:MAG TPA: hypothetical protein ENG87_01710 [Candidatus Pacearchaeota archaeon]|nr:hypothetical protein [Candidatus Pacearchaeota archaeon]